MSKLTKKEIDTRRKRMQEEALKTVAKTEQLNIRVDEKSIIRLYNVAAKAGSPVGTMVREWILERLASEEQGKSTHRSDLLLEAMSALQSRIEQWDQHCHHS